MPQREAGLLPSAWFARCTVCKTQIIPEIKKNREHDFWALDKAISVDKSLTKCMHVVVINTSIGRVQGVWTDVRFPDLSTLYFVVQPQHCFISRVSFMKYKGRKVVNVIL